MMTPPPLMANKIINWANEKLTEKDWKQASKKFSADITDWKYFDRFCDSSDENKKRADDWLGEITVVLIRVEDITKIKSLGSFSWHNRRLRIKICKGVLFEVVVLHELIHWSQAYLELLAGYIPNKKKRVEFFFNVGYPSKKIRDFYVVPQWKNNDAYREVWEKRGIRTNEELHFLNDIEFYPNLYLLCLKFSYICSELKLSRSDAKEAFRVFTASKDYDSLDGELKSKFFRMIPTASGVCYVFKKFSKGKWKKCVKEIWKEYEKNVKSDNI